METQKDIYKTSRFLYIVEAALEYFIALMMIGAYLAKLTEAIGISDAVTGILSAFVSLGFGFQVVALFLANKRPVKRWVTVLHSLNQLFFALAYLVPFLSFTRTQKTVIFVVLLLLGYIFSNVVNAPKINWYMDLVDDRKRGSFTATKEMVSLIGGMIFSLSMGLVIDNFEAAGNIKGAFIVCGVSIFVLMLLHSATLIFSKEKPCEVTEKVSTKQMIGDLLKDKKLFKVILVGVLWNIAHYACTSFYGTYQTKELGFTMTFVSILGAMYAIVRSIFSRPLGKFADKHSFVNMLNICFIIAMVGFAVNVFTIPSNGKIFFTAYYALYAIAMAGINSATINLIYDYVDKEKRIGALAINCTLSGFAGFFTTLCVSPLVEYIQENGNVFFGISMYAQQLVSLISVVLMVGLLVYLNLVVKKLKNVRDTNDGQIDEIEEKGKVDYEEI